MRLVSFGGDVIPPQTLYQDNFADFVTATERLPGVSGGYDALGTRATPSEVGNVRVDFWLIAPTPAQMRAKVDAVRRWGDLGVQRLVLDPYNGEAMRWCYARVNSIQMSEAVLSAPHRQQKTQVNFQVPTPFWYSTPTGGWLWDDGSLYNAPGLVWGGARTTHSISHNTSISLTNNGTAPAALSFDITAGGTTSSIGATLIAPNGIPSVGFDWLGTLATGEVLMIDGSTWSVQVRRADGGLRDAYAQFQPRDDTAGFIALPPGTHTLRWSGTYAASATLTTDYYDTWR